jgi:hypothetical protein
VGEFEWVGWTVKGARLIKFKNACKGALRFPQDKPALVQATRKGGELERSEKRRRGAALHMVDWVWPGLAVDGRDERILLSAHG